MTRSYRVIRDDSEQPDLAHAYEYPACGTTPADAARMAADEFERKGRRAGLCYVREIPQRVKTWRVYVTEDV